MAALDEILSLNEAAERAGLSAVRLRQLVDSGRLQGKKIGNSWAILAADLESFLGRERAPGRLDRRREVEGRLRVDLRSRAPIHIDATALGVPSVRLWFLVDNRSDIDVELDRLVVDVWYGQPIAYGSYLHRQTISAGELVETVMFQAYLTGEQAAQIRQRALDPGIAGPLTVHVDSYFNSDLGSLHVRHSLERGNGEFQVFNLQ